MTQRALFDEVPDKVAPNQPAPGAPGGGRRVRRAGAGVQPAAPDGELQALAAALQQRWGGRLHLGTSSWHFPGWAGWVWRPAADGSPYSEAQLSRHGLEAYAQHPLFRCVSLDRAFYRPLPTDVYARLAAQVSPDFRFVVKAPAVVTDSVVRSPGTGRAMDENPGFLDPRAAVELVAQPALEGLGERLGVLVFQLSPLTAQWLAAPQALLSRIEALATSLAPVLGGRALPALELRDPGVLTPELAALLRHHGWRFCLGLHDRMPALEAQLPMQRALWPGDLVCRWNLQSGLRYEQAREAWAPFDRLRSEDPATRMALAKVARATLDAGHRVFITINNKAEGCAPASVVALARQLLAGPLQRSPS